MKLDFTQELNIDSKSYKIYQYLRIILYLMALAGAIYLFVLVAFPIRDFTFSFSSPTSSKNNIDDPRNDKNETRTDGKIKKGEKLLFNTSLVGNYSKVQIKLSAKKADKLSSAEVEVRKSHRVFFYPEGTPLGFKEGSLLKTDNNFYLISEGRKRKFSSSGLLRSLGFPLDAFEEVPESDLEYNESGEDITDREKYPDGSLFKIDNDYYLLTNQKLAKFITPNAYQTQYNPNQAISKSADFLEQYPLDENNLGFSDGTLISYGESAFVISEGAVFPIDSADTYVNKGWSWDDLIPVSGDELAFYRKEKLFNINDVHPTGTVLLTENNQWYYIKDKEKHLLPSSLIAKSWLKRTPVAVSSLSFTTANICSLKPARSLDNTYTCSISSEEFKNLIGNDYQFYLSPSQDIKLSSANVVFEKAITWENLKLMIKELIIKISANYAPKS